jgi:outer membrane lipoprotein carrier protein
VGQGEGHGRKNAVTTVRLLLGCLTLLSGAPALAAPWFADWDGIRKAAATVKTLETNFVQTKTLKILTKPLVSRGVMAYRRPSDLRWEYQSPLQTLLVVRRGNAQRLLKHGDAWVNDSSAKLEAMKVVLGEINLWLDGNFGASKTFKPELRAAQTGQPAHVELVPMDPSLAKIISRIDIIFADRPGTVSAIDIFEGNEGVTHIVFEQSRFNGEIPEQRFEAPR